MVLSTKPKIELVFKTFEPPVPRTGAMFYPGKLKHDTTIFQAT